MDPQPNANAGRTPPSDELAGLLRRLLVVASQLRLASKDFGDLARVPQEHVAAALVVQEASAGLNELYDRLHEWHAGHEDASAHRVSLVLKEYAPERKISVIRVLREAVPGTSLTAAKALLEGQLPAPIAQGLPTQEAQALLEKLAAAGAVCRLAS